MPSMVRSSRSPRTPDTGALEFLFDTYRQTGAASAVVRRFASEGVSFPRRLQRGLGKGDVLWGPIDNRRVAEVLHNPRYAGAFVYGRRKTSYDMELRSHLLYVPREQWHTLIRDAHAGYITWDEFEGNQVRRRSDRSPSASPSAAARPGKSHYFRVSLCVVGVAGACDPLPAGPELSGVHLPVHRGHRASRRQPMPALRRQRS